MLHLLPTEIALESLSYLPLHSLCNVSRVSVKWHDIVAVNESSIYHTAAILHRFVPSAKSSLSESVSSYAERSVAGVRDWKAFCHKRWQIERAWMGRGPSTCKELKTTGTSVHRIKVDERLGLVITTLQHGGLYVSDLKNDRVLWSLGQFHVVRCAHCEYDNGFLIFNRNDNCKEIWRLNSDYPQDLDPADLPTSFPPDEQMLTASGRAGYMFSSPTNRGHFKPWALLPMPELSRAFRFVYPTLFATSENNAYLWDIPSSTLLQTIHDIQAMTPGQHGRILGRIHYVEVNDRYAFICGSQQLRIFSREGGALLFSLSPEQLAEYSYRNVRPRDGILSIQKTLLTPHSLFSPLAFSGPHSFGLFMAVHVSASSNELVALTTRGLLLIIRDFERVISKEVALTDALVQLNFSSESRTRDDYAIYLAFEHGKIGVVTRGGIFLISLGSEVHTGAGDLLISTFPIGLSLSVCSLTTFDKPKLLPYISCLQITDTGLYFNWEPTPPPGSRPPNVNDQQTPLALQVDVFHHWENGGGGGNGQMLTNIIATQNAWNPPVFIDDEDDEDDDESEVVPDLEPIIDDSHESQSHANSSSSAGGSQQAHAGPAHQPQPHEYISSEEMVEDDFDIGEAPHLASMDDDSGSEIDAIMPVLQELSDSDSSDDAGGNDMPGGDLGNGPFNNGPLQFDGDDDDDMVAAIADEEEAIELFAQWMLGEGLSTVYCIDFLPPSSKKRNVK